MYYSTTKKLGSKNQKKQIFAEGLTWPSAKGIFAEGLANGPRQRIFKNKIKNLCRVPDGGHSAKNDASGRRDPSGHFAEGRLFSAKASLPRAYLCRGLLGLALGK